MQTKLSLIVVAAALGNNRHSFVGAMEFAKQKHVWPSVMLVPEPKKDPLGFHSALVPAVAINVTFENQPKTFFQSESENNSRSLPRLRTRGGLDLLEARLELRERLRPFSHVLLVVLLFRLHLRAHRLHRAALGLRAQTFCKCLSSYVCVAKSSIDPSERRHMTCRYFSRPSAARASPSRRCSWPARAKRVP